MSFADTVSSQIEDLWQPCIYQHHFFPNRIWWFSQCFKVSHYYYIHFDDMWSVIFLYYFCKKTSLVAQMVKHLPTVRETQVRSLFWEDPLEKEIAAHSSTLAWKIPWTEECCRLQSMGSQRVRHDWATSLSLCKKTTILKAQIMDSLYF